MFILNKLGDCAVDALIFAVSFMAHAITKALSWGVAPDALMALNTFALFCAKPAYVLV